MRRMLSASVMALLSWFGSAQGIHAADEELADRAQDRGAFPDSAVAFLFRLQSRDRRFDNVTLEAESSWVEKIDPQAIVNKAMFHISIGPKDVTPLKYPDPLPAPYDQAHRVLYKLSVRGPEITLEGNGELEDVKYPIFSYMPMKKLKWTTAGGNQRVYAEMPDGSSSYIRDTAGGLIELDRMSMEFSLGFGYAKRMKQLNTYQVADDRQLVSCSGTIHIAMNDDSICELTIDKDYVVRHAKITTSAGRGLSVIESDTKGLVKLDGFPAVAADGTFKRQTFSKRENGERVITSVQDDKGYHFVRITGPLSDEQYEAITRIEPRADTVIEDLRTGKQVAPAPKTR
jgi:hypothetical protein